MLSGAHPDPLPGSATIEQRMVIRGVRWSDYLHLGETLEIPGLRMTYCEEALELMGTSFTHELHKATIARLVELYAFLRDLPLIGYGSTTFRSESNQRGTEPDECYCVGRRIHEGEFPDIVLEVIHTRPMLDKLHVYSGLEVPEVWLFQDGAFELHRLSGARYERIERSGFLPDLDLVLIARLAVRPDQDEALHELRRLI